MEKIKIFKGAGLVLIQKGVFDFQKVYSGIVDFFYELGYDYVHEQQHSDKTKQKGREIKINFTADKEVNEILMLSFPVRIEMKHIKKEAGLLSGELMIIMSPYVAVDYKKEWSHKKFKAFILKINKEYIRKDEVEKQEEVLYEHAQQFAEYAKKILGMET